jgi:hypothetical protein
MAAGQTDHVWTVERTFDGTNLNRRWLGRIVRPLVNHRILSSLVV